MIVVAGLPRSGNNLIREHILRCIRRRKPYMHEDVVIWHGAEATPRFVTPVRFVIPVRNPRCRGESAAREGFLAPFPEDVCRTNVFRAIAAISAPVKLVSYEALVDDPEGTGWDLLDWLGYPWVSFPTGGDDHRPTGSLYDGNAKYGGSRQAPPVFSTPEGS